MGMCACSNLNNALWLAPSRETRTIGPHAAPCQALRVPKATLSRSWVPDQLDDARLHQIVLVGGAILGAL